MIHHYITTRKSLFISLLILLQYQVNANLVVIECTFPCLSPNDVCEVNNYFVKCTPRTSQTRWILENISSLPKYQGDSSELGSACMTAPQPRLKDASHLSTNTSETIVNWPLYDAYYSNCNQGLYCDKANMCVKQLIHGEVCDSNSQCLTGLVCSQNTCQDVSSSDVSAATNESSQTGYNTVHIALTVVGIVLFLSLLVTGFFILRRKKRLAAAAAHDKEQQLIIPAVKKAAAAVTATTRSNSSSSTASAASLTPSLRTQQQVNHHNITNILQPDYESTFVSSPSQQQQELQFQLLKIQHSQAATAAPPPYSP